MLCLHALEARKYVKNTLKVHEKYMKNTVKTLKNTRIKRLHEKYLTLVLFTNRRQKCNLVSFRYRPETKKERFCSRSVDKRPIWSYFSVFLCRTRCMRLYFRRVRLKEDVCG